MVLSSRFSTCRVKKKTAVDDPICWHFHLASPSPLRKRAVEAKTSAPRLALRDPISNEIAQHLPNPPLHHSHRLKELMSFGQEAKAGLLTLYNTKFHPSSLMIPKIKLRFQCLYLYQIPNSRLSLSFFPSVHPFALSLCRYSHRKRKIGKMTCVQYVTRWDHHPSPGLLFDLAPRK